MHPTVARMLTVQHMDELRTQAAQARRAHRARRARRGPVEASTTSARLTARTA